jgi:acyl dehydratase
MTELSVGARIQGNARTITDAEIALLPAIMGAINPLFHDEESARRGPLGRRVLYGPALLGIAIAGTEPLIHDHLIGLVGITDVRFHKPVGVGDTITPVITIVERIEKPASRGDLLLVTDEVMNQDETVVLTFARTIMVKRPPA